MSGADRGESKTTVAVAFSANLVIAIAKLVGGVITGSVAMLAEGGHSIADTANQVFLWVSLSLGGRPPDEEHPFGYGKERFFWAFLAAMFIFVAGALFSWVEGIRALLSKGGEESFLVAYIVLGAALIAESISLARGLRQTRDEASELGRSVRQHLRRTKDPTTKVVVFEDTAAVLGILFAATGILLHQLTGDHRWDAVGSIAVGFLLAYVAYRLGRDTKDLLIGEAALQSERDQMRAAIARHPEVLEVFEVLTMALGPHSLLVAVRAELRAEMNGADVVTLCEQLEADVRAAVPDVMQFFIDPTPKAGPR